MSQTGSQTGRQVPAQREVRVPEAKAPPQQEQPEKPAPKPQETPERQTSTIFRKAALERLSSPEQLDYLMSITTPIGWLALSAIGLISFLILLWAFLGSIPDKVSGKGIMIRGGAVFDVSAGSDGVITEILVKPGDQVTKGGSIATISQSGLDLKILLARRKLADLQAQNADITAREEKNNNAALKALKEERANRKQVIDDLKQQEGPLLERFRNEESLAKRGLSTQAAVIRAREGVFGVQHQISENSVRLTEITSEEVKIVRETQEKRNQRQKEMDETSRQLHEYETQLEWSTKVVSPYRGRVLEKLVERGNIVAAKDRVITVETEDASMQAVIFIPAGDGKKVQPNMGVQVAPSTVKPEEFGFMLGAVRSVSFFPSTPEGMQRVLRNDQLVKELSEKGAPIEVSADLLADPNTRSGYKWSSPGGPPIGIFSGTLCSGSIIVAERRPVEYVIPKLKEALGIK
jgi:HlyD family secretion protein